MVRLKKQSAESWFDDIMNKWEDPEAYNGVTIMISRNTYNSTGTYGSYSMSSSCGNSMSGSTIEPYYSIMMSTVGGSGSAIPPGEYNVINAVAGQRYRYYLEDVYGRSGIAIHGGTHSGHSSGCIIVGSGQNLQYFYEFIENNRGDGGVRIIIE